MERSIPARIQRIIGPLPGQREARAFSFLALVGGLVACGLSLYFGFRGETFMGRPMGYDFVAFYSAGQVLNQHQSSHLYDVPFVSRLEHQNLPNLPASQVLVFGYAPCAAQLFRPFALLPYVWAYSAWLLFSLAVYAGGLVFLFRNRLPGAYGRTAFLLCLSSPMYTLETWIGGQPSVIAFLAAVLFVRCFESRRWLLAGVALGLLSYKPSLLAVPAAVMLLSAPWRMLAGLCTGSLFVALASFATAGLAGLQQWAQTIRTYSSLALAGDSLLRRTKYVDLNSFFAILFGGNWVSRILAALAICTALLLLAWACWKARDQALEVQRCLWAAAFAWTLIINIYVGVYDTIILVPAVALVAYSVANRGKQEQAALQLWALVLWLVPWLTQSWAEYLRLQAFTLVLAGFGYWALTLVREGLPASSRVIEEPVAVSQSGR
jgi:alpha-1,2-mannosyltransferase